MNQDIKKISSPPKNRNHKNSVQNFY